MCLGTNQLHLHSCINSEIHPLFKHLRFNFLRILNIVIKLIYSSFERTFTPIKMIITKAVNLKCLLILLISMSIL